MERQTSMPRAPHSPSYIDVLDEADHSYAPVADDRSALPDPVAALLDVVDIPLKVVVQAAINMEFKAEYI